MKSYSPEEKHQIAQVEKMAAEQLKQLKASGMWQTINHLKEGANRPEIVTSPEQENVIRLAYFRVFQAAFATRRKVIAYPIWRMMLLDNAQEDAERKGGQWVDYYECYIKISVEAAGRQSAENQKPDESTH